MRQRIFATLFVLIALVTFTAGLTADLEACGSYCCWDWFWGWESYCGVSCGSGSVCTCSCSCSSCSCSCSDNDIPVGGGS